MATYLEEAVKLTFGQWLLVRRKELKLSQGAIAEALGITRQSVGAWEKGEAKPSLSIDQTKALCRLLQVTLDEIPGDE